MNWKKKAFLTAVFLIIFGHSAHANSMVRMDIIRKIESSGNSRAWNRKEDARGLYQIRKCVLQEYNQYNRTNYSMNDLWDPALNEQIAKWYLEVRIPQMLRHFKLEITTENIIICYNAGISNAIKHRIPEITTRYIQKYQNLEK